MLSVHPLIGNHIDVCMAHNGLQQHVQTMIAMRNMHLRGRLVPVRVVMHFFAQGVETVDLVHKAEAGYIGIIAETEFRVDLDGFGWIFMDATNVRGGYGPDFLIEETPGGVDRRGRVLPVDRVVVEKGAVELNGFAVEVDGIQDRCYSLLVLGKTQMKLLIERLTVGRKLLECGIKPLLGLEITERWNGSHGVGDEHKDYV
jgi:hypothetical protein